MIHTAYKVFSVGAFEKEEQWLNEMSAKGLQLIDVGICKYVFAEGQPREYVYRLELLEDLPSTAESMEYIQFLKEVGVEKVGSFFRWVYFRKKATEGSFDLYSDIDSRLKHYKRINLLCNWIIGMNLAAAIFNLFFFADSMKYFKMGILNTVNYSNLGISIFNIGVAAGIFLISSSIRRKLKEFQKEHEIRE